MSAFEISAIHRACVFALAMFAVIGGRQPRAAENHVLRLGGGTGALQIQSESFADLEEVTVEGWVRFRTNIQWARFFDFGMAGKSVNVGRAGDSPHLNLEVFYGGVRRMLIAPNTFRTNEWSHVAAVITKSRFEVYFNGLSMAAGTNSLPFNQLTRGERIWLGRNNWFDSGFPDIVDSNAEMDEFRVWGGARTREQIRDGMFRSVEPNEPGLALLLTFEGGEPKDFGPRKIPVSLVGAASIEPMELPKEGLGFPAASVATGRVLDKNGEGVAEALIAMKSGSIVTEICFSGSDGKFEGGALADFEGELVAQKGQLAGQSRAVSLRMGGHVEESITLYPPETIGGTVAAFDKSPLPGIAVSIFFGASTNALRVATTDLRGGYSFEGLPPGDYRVQIAGRNGPIFYRNGEALIMAGGSKLTDVNFVTAPPPRGIWQTYNAAMGLPSDNEVRRILFEPNGTVWFATVGGAARFDGAEWQTFTTDEGLPDDYVFNLARDVKGDIWLATAGGIARFDGETLRGWGGKEGIHAMGMDGILAHSDGSVWFAGRWIDGQPFLLRFKDDKMNFLRKADGLPGRVFKMCEGKGGEIWMCGELAGGLARYDGKTFSKYTHPDMAGTTDTPSIGTDGAVWFGGQKGVWRWDGANMKLYSLVGRAARSDMACTFWTRAGELWVCGPGGIFRFDGNEFQAVKGEDGQPILGAISIAEAADGAMWFGTLTRGALRYDPEPALETFTVAHGLAANSVFFSRRTSDGLLQFHSNLLAEDASQWNGSEFRSLTDVLGLRGWKGKILESSQGVIIPTGNGPMVKLGERVQQLGGNDAPPGMCFAAIEGADGSIWLASNTGIGRFKEGKWTRHGAATGFPLSWSFSLAMDRTGRLFVGNFDAEGLAVFEGEKWRHYTVTNGLPGMAVSGMIADADGSVWIAMDGGLSQFKDGRFTNFGKSKDGLPARRVNAVYRDSRGWLWVGSAMGVTRWDGRVWSTIRGADGLGGEATRSIVEGADGDMWLGSEQGLTRYKIKKQKAVTPMVTVLLDKAFRSVEELPRILNGRRVQFRAEVGDIKTRPDVRRFVWGVFSGNWNGESAEKLPGWMPATSNPTMEWTAPAAGKYTMGVRYVDRDLNYSDPVLVPFEVVPPWYMNAFIAGPVGVGSVGLLGWAFVARMLYMQKRREAERLRAEMLQQEKDARTALELKNRELERAMEAAESANRTKSQFLATMSHELRTPLNAILGYSEMLQEELEDRKDVIPDLQKIHGAGKHLLGLINDVLDLSKIEAGKMTIFPENFEIAATVQEIARTVEPLVTKNGNRLTVSIAPGIGSMFSDLTKVRQTLFNLLSNAAKFTENGNVSITVEELPGSSLIQFAIADSGIGMTEEQIGKLFEAFSQADASTSRKYGGTGLGLALSRNFCRLLGGDIEVRSEHGKGSVFTVRLPRRIPAAASEVPAASLAAAAKDRPHILVIDDDPAVRELMNRHLMKEGYAVSLAASGEQGLALARERKPDIITVDIIMPGQDGWSVLNSLKADKGLQNIPVVLVSMLDEKPLGFSLGAADYIVKPIDWDRLSGILQKLRPELPSNEVLVVEDDAAMRDMLTRQLEKHTWSVRAAENGRVALEVLKSHTPGIVLLDLMMPEMDGFAFLEEFRRNKEWQNIPVIVVTAKDLSPEDLAQLDGRIRKVVQKSAQTMDEVVAEIRAASASTKTARA